jgi:hypothetical protein
VASTLFRANPWDRASSPTATQDESLGHTSALTRFEATPPTRTPSDVTGVCRVQVDPRSVLVEVVVEPELSVPRATHVVLGTAKHATSLNEP